MAKYIYVTPYKNGKPQRMVLMKKGGSVKDIGADYVVPVKSMSRGGGVTYEGRKTAGERYFGGFEDIDVDLGFSPSSPGLYDPSVGFGGIGATTYGIEGPFEEEESQEEESQESGDPYYYNPYGGMDVRQASFILGKSLSGEASTGTGILAGAKVGLGLGRDIASGMGLGNREAFLREEKQRRDREARYEERGMAALARPGYEKGGKITYSDILKYRDEGMQLMKKGGNIDFGQRMTGEYIEGLPEGQEDQAVVEVEAGEHILQPDGSMQEVVGDKHSQGGEKLSEEDIQEGSIVISDYIKVGAEKAKYFREKYGIKLTAGHTFADVVDRVEKKIGVTKITKELEDLYKKLEKEEKTTEHKATKDLNREYISEKIYEKEQEKAELEEERLELMEDVYNQQEGGKGQEGEESDIDYEFLKKVAQESGLDELQAQEVVQEFKRGGSYFKIPKYQDGGSRRKTLREWFEEAKGLGYTGGENVADIQKWYAKEFPDSVVESFRDGSNTITAKGIENIKRSDPQLLKKAGVNPNKEPSKYTEEERAKISQAIFGTDIDTKEFWVNQFQDGLWDYRTPSTPSREQVESLSGSLQAIPGDGGLRGPELPNLANRFVADRGVGPSGRQTESGVGGDDKIKTLAEKKKKAILPHMPDDWVLPPSSMTPPRKNVTEFGLDEAMYVSPDQALARNQTQFASQMAAADSLPPNQKAAYLASLQESAAMVDMQAQAAADQMYSQAEAETRRFNIGQRDKQSMAAGQNAESFEDKMFRTKAIYDENVRGFLDYMRNTNTTRFKDVRNQNLVGSMMEDYYIDANGQVYIKPGSRFSGSVGQIGTGQYNPGETEEERKKREAAEKKKRAGTR